MRHLIMLLCWLADRCEDMVGWLDLLITRLTERKKMNLTDAVSSAEILCDDLRNINADCSAIESIIIRQMLRKSIELLQEIQGLQSADNETKRMP